MRLFLLTISLWLISSSWGWAQGKYEAQALSVPLVIDGQPNDWPTEAWRWHGKAPVRYALAYDDSSLFLTWSSEDPHWLNHVLMTGLTCQLEPQNRNRLARAIRFPTGIDPVLRPSDPNLLARYLFRLQNRRPELLQTMPGTELIDFLPERDTLWTDEPEELGVQVAAQFDERGRTLTVEYRIDFDQLPTLSVADFSKLQLHWRSGQLGRPEQLRGGDAAGLGTAPGGQYGPPSGKVERQWYQRLDTYRSYASPSEMKVRKVVLAEGRK